MITDAAAAIDTEPLAGVVSLAAAGDVEAFTQIVSAYHPDLLRIAYVACGDADLAADAVQAAWAIAWRRLGGLRDPSRLRPWLMSVAANEARQLIRRHGRQRVREITVIDAASPATESASGIRIDLADALATLDPRDRTILGLRFLAGLDSVEIGREVGMTPTAVRSRVARALHRLRRELGDE